MLAQLIPLDGGAPIELTNDITLVGRKAGVCDLVLDRSSVSKMHCLLVKTDGLLFIRDLGSTNGTKVNGQKITRGALLPGDELAFARVKFRVHLGPAPAVAVPENEVQTEMLDVREHPELAELRQAASAGNDNGNADAVSPADADLDEDHESPLAVEEAAPDILPIDSFQPLAAGAEIPENKIPEIVPESGTIEPQGADGRDELIPEEELLPEEEPKGVTPAAKDVAESDSDVRLLPDESAVF